MENMREKIHEEISQISGTETEPFRRYCGKIDVESFISILQEEKQKAEASGYTNLKLLIREDTGIIDIDLYGDRKLTDEEKDIDERIMVITRVMKKTSKGLTREDIFKRANSEE